MMRTTQGMQADEQFFQQTSQLAAAATNAASAAEHALTALQSSGTDSSSSGGVTGTLQAGLAAARDPDTFDGSDPHGFLTWKFVFTSWLTLQNRSTSPFLEKVEQLEHTHTPAMSAHTEDDVFYSTVRDLDQLLEGSMLEV